jgi:energy-coupling factor transport system permease protein
MAAASVLVEPRTLALIWVGLLLAAAVLTRPLARLEVAVSWAALAAMLVGASAAVFDSANGGSTPLLALAGVHVGAHGLRAGAVVALRVLVFATAAALWTAVTDPSRLVASLEQHLRLPPEWAVSSLAAYRLVPALASDWQTVRDAHRVRLGHPPRGLTLVTAATGLLVSALRRSERLAVAIEARGFSPQRPRTRWHRRWPRRPQP